MDPPNTLLVRDATQGDVAAIAQIYAWHVLHGRASFEETPPGIDEMRERLRAVQEGGRPYLVGEADGRIVGYAYAGPYRARSAYRFTLEDSIYLDPAAVGRGFGARLMEALLARCRAGPWREVVAIIGDSANEASIGLHRKFGFVHVGTLTNVGFKHGRWLDSVIMQLTLRNAGD